ncbi:MAG: arsenite/tail-anchored protein-transporting ATPase [Streptomycetaceae bacterium]|nr:arsenite/tail-anchored protein-transporting ATPase [Streptomycetaceae bacterium]
MRTLLITGPGGAGRTTVAAATAAATAARGLRVLLLSADHGAGLDTVLGTPLGAGTVPTQVTGAPGLWAARIDATASFRKDATDLQDHLGALFDLLGAAPLDPEEITELPGAEVLTLLRALRDAAAKAGTPDAWDVVVADLPPTHTAIAVLSLPEQLRRYLRRLVPAERQAARALRPVLAQLAGVPMPDERLYEAAGRVERELGAAQAVLQDAGTTVRLVVEPGPSSDAALRPARAALALFGHRLEALIANRLLPTGSADPFLGGLSGQQQKHLKTLYTEYEEHGHQGTAVHEVPHLGRDPRGADDLATLGRTLAAAAHPGPGGPAGPPWTVEDRLSADGYFLWRLPLPGATRDSLDLVRRGEELVLDVAGFRRIVRLPSALRRCTVAGAALREGVLQVRFTPDPQIWPR